MKIDKKHFSVVMLAAGKAKRMNAGINKNFMELHGKPMLFYSLLAFEKEVSDLILVVDEQNREKACKIAKEFQFERIEVTIGGRERYESVMAGLDKVRTEYVHIHDAARCLVTKDIIKRCAESVKKNGACIAAMPSKDTIKISSRAITLSDQLKISNTPGRSRIWMAQTPQTFRTDLVRKAYNKTYENKTIEALTDDAQTLEQIGVDVMLEYGDYSNFKVTEETDLILADAILNTRNEN